MEEILKKIYELTHKRGFIYSLLMIIRRDQTVKVSEYGIIDTHDRLITEEIGLLLRYWIINNPVLFDAPYSLEELSSMKHAAISLMDSLHSSFIQPISQSFEPEMIKSSEDANSFLGEIFPLNQRIREAIFYSGDSLYDFEYTDYLPQKYKYDLEWLKTNKQFCPEEVIPIIQSIKKLLTEKNRAIPDLDENMRHLLEHPAEQNDDVFLNDFIEYVPYFTNELFNPDPSIRENAIKSFCLRILDLYTITASDLAEHPGLQSYLSNFSLDLSAPFTEEYHGPGYYNVLQTKPLLKFGSDKYMVAVVYWLFMSAYEVPFYWLMGDKDYEKTAGTHRGQASEDIAFDILYPVFGDNLYRDIVIKGPAKKAITDIDLLAVVGCVAICFQIKSKKLSETSKQGDIESIKNDFEKAVISALKQGAKCRDSILNSGKEKYFYGKGNQPFELPRGIKEVYVVCLTSENYPGLTSQVIELANKNRETGLFPIAFSVFDLRLIAYYLNTPYDFSYYIRQRIETADYFLATTEMSLLGYHMAHKLWKDPSRTRMYLDESFASDIDQNFYPIFANLQVEPGTEDRIANRWRNPDFEQLWKSIASHPDPRKTQVVFDLFDLSSETVDELMTMIRAGHERVRRKSTRVAISLVLDQQSSFGLTFIIQPPLFSTPLLFDMEVSGAAHKYQHKCNKWVTLGRRLDSPNNVDMLMVDENPWQFNESMESAVEKYQNTTSVFTSFSGNKIGRNEPCPCGSGKKYKNCHGK